MLLRARVHGLILLGTVGENCSLEPGEKRDTCVKLVQSIKLAMCEVKRGSETVRTPRLPLAGKEREEVLALVRQAIRTRPVLGE